MGDEIPIHVGGWAIVQYQCACSYHRRGAILTYLPDDSKTRHSKHEATRELCRGSIKVVNGMAGPLHDIVVRVEVETGQEAVGHARAKPVTNQWTYIRQIIHKRAAWSLWNPKPSSH